MPSRVLVVDDEPTIRLSLRRFFEGEGYEVAEADGGRAALEVCESWSPDVALLDVRMPDLSGVEVLRQMRRDVPDAVVLMISAHADIEQAVDAMKLGARDFLIKPVDLERLALAVDKAIEEAALRQENRYLRERGRHPREEAGDLVLGRSESMQEVGRLIRILAQNPSTTVLLTGESGTGKGMVAQAIHDLSERREGPFVEVNCAGLSHTFLESELFGHMKGAFTDAKEKKRGLLEAAHRGTIFLDEIGDLDLALQPKILRVLETKRFRRLGGVEDIEVDVRVIAATNRDLPRMLGEGTFREDLFYRLNVMPIRVPPLRERTSDVIVLAAEFVRRFNEALRKTVTGIGHEAASLLRAYSWPGNVRELKNIIERAVILCSEGEIRPPDLPEDLRHRRVAFSTDGAPGFRTLEEVEREHITTVLVALAGNRSRAARALHIARSTLIDKIKRYRLNL